MRVIDGIRIIRRTKIHRQKTKFWFWLVLFVFIIPLFYFGRLSADSIIKNVEVLSLFREGKFLVLFQNNAEIRSSGGFIGSFAVVEVKNFEVKNIKFNTNIYTLDRDFAKENFVLAPAPVAKMLKGESWTLRDSNYLASFSEASSDILSFYEKETGDEVDGIIALNAKVIIDLLKLVGPINLDKDNVTISAENFYSETQYRIEKEYYQNPENWAINEPKSFIKDLYPAILSRAIEDKIALLNLLKREIAEKEIIFYFKNPQKQEIAASKNWTGEILDNEKIKNLFGKKGPFDYLYINSNSYSGNKSSLNVKEEITYELSEAEDLGRKGLKADLKISRIHAGSNDWPDGKNTNWMRIFVPKEVKLVEAKLNEKDIFSKVAIGSGAGKTYFGLEVVTEPGQANILELTYFLPFSDSYNLLIQKQPGVVGDKLKVIFEDKVLFDGELNEDRVISKK